MANKQGELLTVQLTPGNTDDRKSVPNLLQQVFGKVSADKDYVSAPLAKQRLEAYGIELFGRPKRNMKNHHMRLSDQLPSRKRSILETIIEQLKNISQIEHSWHRSPVNCTVNLLCSLIAYCYQPKKPSLNLDFALPASA